MAVQFCTRYGLPAAHVVGVPQRSGGTAKATCSCAAWDGSDSAFRIFSVARPEEARLGGVPG